jgi:hypothetical protein
VSRLPVFSLFLLLKTYTSRFNVNSASWDRLWVAWCDPSGNSPAAPVIAAGFKKAGAFTDLTTGAATFDGDDVGRAQYALNMMLVGR